LNLISRRRFFAGLGAATLVVAGDALAIEPRRVVVTKHLLSSPDARPDDPSVRVVQISDLHLQRVSGHSRRIAEEVNTLRPDMILFSGDMIDKSDRIPELDAFLSLLDERPLKFATLGNWEHWAHVNTNSLKDMYSARGCRLLVNETAAVRHADRDLLITGVDDWTGGRPDLAAALKDVAPRRNHLLVAHSPVFRDLIPDVRPPVASAASPQPASEAPQYSFSCVLSGHTHGGQVAFFGWAPIRPAGSGKYVSGWYRDVSPPLYVSRGLGTSLAPVRFGASPEIAFFEWRLSAA
jgi:uncharacterized protein